MISSGRYYFVLATARSLLFCYFSTSSVKVKAVDVVGNDELLAKVYNTEFSDASFGSASKYVKGILSRSELKFPNTLSERDMPDIHIHGTSKKLVRVHTWNIEECKHAQANEHAMSSNRYLP
eukprot:scaffold8903_cov157-Skeletonema_dohrnii-CCMP3373.AAC.5